MSNAMGAMGSTGATARHNEKAWVLLKNALGRPSEAREKASRLAVMLAGYKTGGEVDARIAKLVSKGLIEQVPTRAQMICGAIDMLRFWISPAAADYYAQQGINYAFHQVLRFLDEPASLADPVGFYSTRDGIIGHLMQVVHANPVYDMQLLQMFDDGLDELDAQLESMLDGTHPRAVSIGAVVEEPDYHGKLLAFVRAYRRDKTTPPLLRSNVEDSPAYRELERTFGSLTAAMRYFCKMPNDAISVARHLVSVRTFPSHLAERA